MKKIIAAYMLTLLVFANIGTAQTFTDEQEARIMELALEAILANPEILPEAIDILQRRQEEQQTASLAQVLSARRELLERDPNAPVLGNPDGDVTIVEFFDYNCPFCKQAAPILKALIEQDNGVRLVYREWPILSEGSVFATRAALASREQGKYEEFHWALMDLPRANESSVLRAAESIGLDIEKLLIDMEAPEIDEHIALSMRLTQELGFQGTPSFVIGDAVAPGLIQLDQMKIMVEDSRNSNN